MNRYKLNWKNRDFSLQRSGSLKLVMYIKYIEEYS